MNNLGVKVEEFKAACVNNLCQIGGIQSSLCEQPVLQIKSRFQFEVDLLQAYLLQVTATATSLFLFLLHGSGS